MKYSLKQITIFFAFSLFLSNPLIAQCIDGDYDDNCENNLDQKSDKYFSNFGRQAPDKRITYSLTDSVYPILVWSGNEFAVVWQEDYDATYFARLDSFGRMIDSEVRVNQDSVDSLVWTGAEYGITWDDYRDGNREIYFTRLDHSGNKIGSDTRITYDSSSSRSPSFAWAGNEYGISWLDNRDSANYEIYFARIDSLGNKIGSDVRVTYDPKYSLPPSLVWSGAEYGIAWADSRNGRPEIYFARIDSLGNKIGLDIRVTYSNKRFMEPCLVWTGNEYGISWSESIIYNIHDSDADGGNDPNSLEQEIYFARLDPEGNKIGSDIRVTYDPATSYGPSLIWTGREYGISWIDGRSGIYEIYFTRLLPSGNKIAPDMRVSHGKSSSFYPSLAWNGRKYAVSWMDGRDGNFEIYFSRLICKGFHFFPHWHRCVSHNRNLLNLRKNPQSFNSNSTIPDKRSQDFHNTNSFINNDQCNDTELIWLKEAFGSSSNYSQDEFWHSIDYNHDGIIDGEDLAIYVSQREYSKN